MAISMLNSPNLHFEVYICININVKIFAIFCLFNIYMQDQYTNFNTMGNQNKEKLNMFPKMFVHCIMHMPTFLLNVFVLYTWLFEKHYYNLLYRMFPSLVNGTTIDWFTEWPHDALEKVASKFLEDMDMEDDVRIVVKNYSSINH